MSNNQKRQEILGVIDNKWMSPREISDETHINLGFIWGIIVSLLEKEYVVKKEFSQIIKFKATENGRKHLVGLTNKDNAKFIEYENLKLT